MATTKRKPRGKNEQGSDFLENPEVISNQLSKTEEFLSKNRKMVFGIGGLIAIIIAAIFIYRFTMETKNATAQEEMFQAVFYFENGNFDNALNGDGNALGFLDIINDYAGTEAANLASFYAGSIYLQQREFQSALDMLEDFSSDDYLVAARKHVLIGDAYMELGNFTNAAAAYQKGASTHPNEQFSPQYLMKAALAFESAGDTVKAISTYDEVINKYSESIETTNARKFKARLEALAAN